MAINKAAAWRGPARNHGGGMSEYRGLVLHIAEGYYFGTINYMLNDPSSASSHFVCGDGALGQGKDGDLAQMLDTSVVAYTQIAGNGHWISVECAGFTPHPLTAAQVETVAQLLAWCHTTHGVPLQLAVDPTGRGLGHHSMGTNGHDNPTDTWTGPTWGHTDCPGPAIYNQKPAILARARQIVGLAPIDTEDDDMGMHYVQAAGNESIYIAPGYAAPSGRMAAYGLSPAAWDAYKAMGVKGLVLPADIFSRTYDTAPQPWPVPAAGNGGMTPAELQDVADAAEAGAKAGINGATITAAP